MLYKTSYYDSYQLYKVKVGNSWVLILRAMSYLKDFKLHENFQNNCSTCLLDSIPGANKKKLSKTALELKNTLQTRQFIPADP